MRHGQHATDMGLQGLFHTIKILQHPMMYETLHSVQSNITKSLLGLSAHVQVTMEGTCRRTDSGDVEQVLQSPGSHHLMFSVRHF